MVFVVHRSSEQLADILFGRADVLVYQFRAVYYIYFFCVETFRKLARNEGLSISGRSIEYYSLYVFDVIFLNYFRGQLSSVEDTFEDMIQLFVESTDIIKNLRNIIHVHYFLAFYELREIISLKLYYCVFI